MKKMKTFLITLFVAIICNTAIAQQMSSWEIKWDFYNVRSEGLMILAGNVGTFRVLCYNRNNGQLFDVVDQYVVASRDGYGVILNCSNPVSKAGNDYSADNFKIFNNGNMYMMDNSGSWSTQIIMRQILNVPDLLQMKQKYGL